MINHPPAKDKGLGCSLFQRYAEILESGWNVTLPEESMLMLTTQYRMVLAVMSLYFYIVLICCNCSMKEFVNSHQENFMEECLEHIHQFCNIFAHLKIFGLGDHNVLLRFVTL